MERQADRVPRRPQFNTRRTRGLSARRNLGRPLTRLQAWGEGWSTGRSVPMTGNDERPSLDANSGFPDELGVALDLRLKPSLQQVWGRHNRVGTEFSYAL